MERNRQIASLSIPVRVRVIAKYSGYLCIILSVMPAVSLAASVLFKEFPFSLPSGIVCIFLVVLGLSLVNIDAPQDLKHHEALAITALTFIFSSAVMAYPLAAAGLPIMDAWFEAVSAVTTTGLTTLSSVEYMPRTFLFMRSFLQWLGGLGFVVFSIALLIGPGRAARRLMDIDDAEDILGGTRTHARYAVTVYILLTAIGMILLAAAGVQWYPALLHTLAAVSTGGFSIYDGSLEGIGRRMAQVTAMLIAVCGSVPLILYYRGYRRGMRSFLKDTQARALITAILIISLLMTASLKSGGMSWEDSFYHGALMAASAQTTTGFSSMSVPALNAPAKSLLIVAMTVGAAAGSTGGGIKIFRLLLLLDMLLMAMRKAVLPRHAVLTVSFQGQRVSDDDIIAAMTLISLFVLVILLSSFVFVAAGYDPLDSVFDVVSATCTVGLSTGVTAGTLPAPLKAVLCIDMLLGRVEILAMLVLLYPGTWFRRKG